ncbi:MAG TPA: DUF4252 domain-containing protein [Thermoanaerobaculia bacterium]|nr:DUF4252 domain-containing protein [Thermoanaerobaculia bacterium]
MKRKLLPFAALLSLASLLAGCGGSPSVEQVRWDLQRRFPEARFDPDEHVHLGRLSMGLVHGIVRMAARHDDDARDGMEIVDQIQSVDFASYKVHALPDLDRLAEDGRFERRLAANGWSPIVRTREKRERTWVYARLDPAGSFRNLFVVSLEGDELTLVRVDGRLDRVLALAMAENPKAALGGGHKRTEAKATAATTTAAGAESEGGR